MKKTIVAAVFAAISAGAQAQVYECELSGGKGWVMDTIFLDIDAEAGTARVVDAITWSKQESWYPAKLVDNREKRLTVSWLVKELKDSKGQIAHNLRYRASFNPQNGNGFATMKPQGYRNDFRGNGKCKPSKAPQGLR